MKANVALDITPFVVPSTVGVRPFAALPQAPKAPVAPWEAPPQGPAQPQYFTVPLRELEADTLDRLCNDFREEVFEQALKERPPEALKEVRIEFSGTREALQALDDLRALLCDQGGEVSIAGTDADAQMLSNALATLGTFLNRLL